MARNLDRETRSTSRTTMNAVAVYYNRNRLALNAIERHNEKLRREAKKAAKKAALASK